MFNFLLYLNINHLFQSILSEYNLEFIKIYHILKDFLYLD